MPVVYTAESLALACLELFVHVDPEDVPDDLVSIASDWPAHVEVETLDEKKLPRGWRRVPAPPALAELGSAWAAEGRTVALRVPSAIIPEEHNLLLNPSHPAIAEIVRGTPRAFAFDPRMRK